MIGLAIIVSTSPYFFRREIQLTDGLIGRSI
jgi:hypothetical protein